MSKSVAKIIFSLLVMTIGFEAHAQSADMAIPLTPKVERYGSFTIEPLSFISLAIAGKFAFRIADHVAITIPFAGQRMLEGDDLVNTITTVDIKDSAGVVTGTINVPGVRDQTKPGAYVATLGIGIAFYPGHKAFTSGWIIEPAVTVDVEFIARDALSIVPALSPQLEFGYGFVWGNGFTLNLGIGAGWTFRVIGSASTDYVSPGFFFASNFGLGYSW